MSITSRQSSCTWNRPEEGLMHDNPINVCQESVSRDFCPCQPQAVMSCLCNSEMSSFGLQRCLLLWQEVWGFGERRGGPQSLDRQAAELRWNLLFIGCCLIDQYTSSLSSKEPVVGAVDFVGERHASGGRRWVTRKRYPRAVPAARRARAGPKDSSTKSTAPSVPNVRRFVQDTAFASSTFHAARSRRWTPACASAGVRPPNAECGRSWL